MGRGASFPSTAPGSEPAIRRPAAQRGAKPRSCSGGASGRGVQLPAACQQLGTAPRRVLGAAAPPTHCTDPCSLATAWQKVSQVSGLPRWAVFCQPAALPGGSCIGCRWRRWWHRPSNCGCIVAPCTSAASHHSAKPFRRSCGGSRRGASKTQTQWGACRARR